MKCFKCGDDFPEEYIHESHDVPCYLFEGNRKGRKNQADKFGRHWLCEGCHQRYENLLRLYLRGCSKTFGKEFFKEEKRDDEKRNS